MAPQDKILVLGDLLLDRRIESDMTRVSPEAPCPVVQFQRLWQGPGGAGNVAANASRMLARVNHVRVMGVAGPLGESEAQILQGLLTEQGCMVRACYGKATSVKTRVTCSGQQILRIDQEAVPLSADAEMLQTLAGLLHSDTDVKLVVVADYNKGAMTPAVISWLLSACRALSIPIFVDARPETIPQYAWANLLKINLREARALAATCVHPVLATDDKQGQGIVLAAWIGQMGHFGSVVITLGEGGSATWLADGTTFLTAASPQRVYDVTGAGDTFMAALAVGYVQDWSLPYSVVRANQAAGLAVAQHGTYVVSRDEWDEAEYTAAGWQGKCMSQEQALAFIDRRRRAGQTVVLTNGCFDMLHYGHLSLLQQAAEQGQLLVVALNSDYSAKQLKGPGRPLFPQTVRQQALARLATVDCVFTFDELSVESTVRAVKPDVLVKGAQYQDSVVPGAEFVARHGGRVFFAVMTSGISTTQLVAANT